MAAKKDTPLCPPEETMWQKYSPHFELPLAGFTSFFVHGLVLGVMITGGIAFLFAADVEATKPPSMDVVMIEGGGTGFEGLGGEPGTPGPPEVGGPKRTEQITPLPSTDRTEFKQPPRLLKDPPLDLGLPPIEDALTPLNSELSIELERLVKEAEAQARKELKKASPPLAGGSDVKNPVLPGTGKPKGMGGLVGPGDGPGIGAKKGPGIGKGGPGGGGPKATKQQIFAWRWHFDLSGNGKEHVRKLIAMGVHVALKDPGGQVFFATDLNRRPADLKPGTLPNLKEVVGWENKKVDSLQSLARELQLPFVPTTVVLLLPKDREDKMAAEEARFAAEQRRDLRTVRRTWFDFRLRGGNYEPVGIRFE